MRLLLRDEIVGSSNGPCVDVLMRRSGPVPRRAARVISREVLAGPGRPDPLSLSQE